MIIAPPYPPATWPDNDALHLCYGAHAPTPVHQSHHFMIRNDLMTSLLGCQ